MRLLLTILLAALVPTLGTAATLTDLVQNITMEWSAETPIVFTPTTNAPWIVDGVLVNPTPKGIKVGTTGAIAIDLAAGNYWMKVGTAPISRLLPVPGGSGTFKLSSLLTNVPIFGTNIPVTAYELKAEKGATNGYAPLGADGLVPEAYLPESQGGGISSSTATNIANGLDVAMSNILHTIMVSYSNAVHTALNSTNGLLLAGMRAAAAGLTNLTATAQSTADGAVSSIAALEATRATKTNAQFWENVSVNSGEVRIGASGDGRIFYHEGTDTFVFSNVFHGTRLRLDDNLHLPAGYFGIGPSDDGRFYYDLGVDAFVFTNAFRQTHIILDDNLRLNAPIRNSTLSSNTFLVVAPGGIIATGAIGSGLAYDVATRTLSATGGGAGEANTIDNAGLTNATHFGLAGGKLGVAVLVKTLSGGYGIILTNTATNIYVALDPAIVSALQTAIDGSVAESSGSATNLSAFGPLNISSNGYLYFGGSLSPWFMGTNSDGSLVIGGSDQGVAFTVLAEGSIYTIEQYVQSMNVTDNLAFTDGGWSGGLVGVNGSLLLLQPGAGFTFQGIGTNAPLWLGAGGTVVTGRFSADFTLTGNLLGIDAGITRDTEWSDRLLSVEANTNRVHAYVQIAAGTNDAAVTNLTADARVVSTEVTLTNNATVTNFTGITAGTSGSFTLKFRPQLIDRSITWLVGTNHGVVVRTNPAAALPTTLSKDAEYWATFDRFGTNLVLTVTAFQ